MARLRTKQVRRGSPFARRTYRLSVQTVGNSETDTPFDSVLPGFAYEIVGVQHFAEAVTATADYNVLAGTRLAVDGAVPAAATRAAATLSATAANLLGSSTEPIVLQATTNGSGAFTGLKVNVTVVPRGVSP